MNNRFLEVTFRDGKPLVAYLSLNRRAEDRSVRSTPRQGGYVIDFAADGRAIGIEITSPASFTVDGLNAILAELHQSPVTAEESKPLAA